MRFLIFSLKGTTQVHSQKLTGPEANHGNTLAILENKESNTQHLPSREAKPGYQVAKSASKSKQKMKTRTGTHLRKSSHHFDKKTVQHSIGSERPAELLMEGCNHNLFSDQNSWQGSMIQGQSLEEENHHSSGKSCSSRLSERDGSRQQKIYETDEFINYLLNYYQTPKYARVYLEPSHMESMCQWQRDVYAKGNGFQVSLRKRGHYSTSLNQEQNLEGQVQVQEDDDCLKICTQDPEPKPEKRRKVDYAKDCTKGLENDDKDAASEAGDQPHPTDGKSHLSAKTPSHQVKDSTSARQSQTFSSCDSIDFELQLTDFLEEISSDSECFSEILSVNKEDKDKSVATYHSSPQGGPLDIDEATTWEQATSSSEQIFNSERKHDGEQKYSKYKLRTTGKRSVYELRYSWFEGNSNFIRDEKNNSQKKRKASPPLLVQ